MVGHYTLKRTLGRGGFAWVYAASHRDLGREAAVKLLSLPNEERDAAEFQERFLREARIIGRLKHPNVVAVYDFGVAEQTGQLYMAMELLHGHDLEAELLNNGPLQPDRAQRLFIGALDALRLAHDAGVVHKDLKPSNLFIASPQTAHERLVLLDFGIAWASTDSRLTRVDTFTGTPAYAAPEYIRHNEVSPALDVYQMGLILSEALTGSLCVVGTSPMEVIIAHCNGDVVIPAELDNTDVGAVIRRATSIEPMQRYANGGEFRQALEAVSFPAPRGGAQPAEVPERFSATTQAFELPLEDTWSPKRNQVVQVTEILPRLTPTQLVDISGKGLERPAPRRGVALAILAFLCVFAAVAAAMSMWSPAPEVTRAAPTQIDLGPGEVRTSTEVEDMGARIARDTSKPPPIEEALTRAPPVDDIKPLRFGSPAHVRRVASRALKDRDWVRVIAACKPHGAEVAFCARALATAYRERGDSAHASYWSRVMRESFPGLPANDAGDSGPAAAQDAGD